MPNISVIAIVPLFFVLAGKAQTEGVIGSYSNGPLMPRLQVSFYADSTFNYTSTEHPTFFQWEGFSEKGKWTRKGDTIILNPQLSKKEFVASELQEARIPGDSMLILTFNHVKRYYDGAGILIRADTVMIESLDYSLNSDRKRRRTRVAMRRTTRCTFAGHIPPEIIVKDRTISVRPPAGGVRSIYIGCFEQQGTRQFTIKDQGSNHLTYTVYSNYFLDGQLRQVRFLMARGQVIYTRQESDGHFKKASIWHVPKEGVLRRETEGLSSL